MTSVYNTDTLQNGILSYHYRVQRVLVNEDSLCHDVKYRISRIFGVCLIICIWREFNLTKCNVESDVVVNCIAGFSFTKMYVCLLNWPAYWRGFHVRRRTENP